MSITTEYTIAHIRHNHRTSIAIMVAVLLASTLICSFSMLVQGFWAWNVKSQIHLSGNWHGELFDDTTGEKLPAVENNPHVEKTMIKGVWQAVRLPEGSAMPYLLLRDADAAYWSEMSEQHTLIEGRLPQKQGEIAVSKLFFDRNPQYRIGDTFTLPVGERMLNGEPISVQSIRRDGESFLAREEKTFVITGKLDITTSTTNPGYFALGFLERGSIKPDDDLTVYLRFHNISKTYKLMPEIARSVGFTPNEYGEYPVRYNGNLLYYYFTTPESSDLSLEALAMGLMTALTVVLVICTFVLIIRGVFSLSADARIKQLGMFRSVGATPAQILHSVLLEGLILSVLPLLASVGLGYAFTLLLANIFNSIVGDIPKIPLSIAFHVPTAAAGILLSLIVVLMSAHKPARKIAKLSPIEAVRGTGRKKLKQRRPHGHPLYRRMFGFSGELAAGSMSARRKSFRSPVAAICISFVLVSGILCMLEIAGINNRLYQEEEYFDVTAMLFYLDRRDEALIREIRSVPNATESVVNSQIGFGMMVDESFESDAFAAIGGFAAVEGNRYNVVKKENGYRIAGTLYGLDDETFSRYCASLGLDPAEYLSADTPKAIVQNIIRPNPAARSREEAERTVEFLRLSPGDTLTLMEQNYDDIKSDYTFTVTVGATTDTFVPEINGGQLTSFRPVFIVPYSQYDAIVANFLPERAAIYRRVDINLMTGVENSLEAERQIDEICGRYLGGEDYRLTSKESWLEDQNRMNYAVQTMDISIAVMIALIGISNAFSTLMINLRLRQREFAMLRSVGLDKRGLGKLLFLEGLNFSLRPILLGLPFLYLVCQVFLWMTNTTWKAFLPFLPWIGILLYAGIALALMGLAYWNGARSIQRDIIVDTLRDETV